MSKIDLNYILETCVVVMEVNSELTVVTLYHTGYV